MADGSDQRELLDRLRIDRDEDDEEGGGRWLIVTFVLVCVLVVAGAFYMFWPLKSDNETTVAESTSAPGANTAPSASPPPQRLARRPPLRQPAPEVFCRRRAMSRRGGSRPCRPKSPDAFRKCSSKKE